MYVNYYDRIDGSTSTDKVGVEVGPNEFEMVMCYSLDQFFVLKAFRITGVHFLLFDSRYLIIAPALRLPYTNILAKFNFRLYHPFDLF